MREPMVPAPRTATRETVRMNSSSLTSLRLGPGNYRSLNFHVFFRRPKHQEEQPNQRRPELRDQPAYGSGDMPVEVGGGDQVEPVFSGGRDRDGNPEPQAPHAFRLGHEAQSEG